MPAAGPPTQTILTQTILTQTILTQTILMAAFLTGQLDSTDIALAQAVLVTPCGSQSFT